MMGIPIDKVAVYRARWQHGTKLRLKADIDDPFTPKKAGDIFTVDYVDDVGHLHGKWKSGGSLALIPERDSFEIVH